MHFIASTHIVDRHVLHRFACTVLQNMFCRTCAIILATDQFLFWWFCSAIAAYVSYVARLKFVGRGSEGIDFGSNLSFLHSICSWQPLVVCSAGHFSERHCEYGGAGQGSNQKHWIPRDDQSLRRRMEISISLVLYLYTRKLLYIIACIQRQASDSIRVGKWERVGLDTEVEEEKGSEWCRRRKTWRAAAC